MGRSSIKSAACMNKVVLLCLEKVAQVNMMVRSCLTGCLFRLLQQQKPPSLTCLPSSVGDLSQHGKVLSPVKKILPGCRSPLLTRFGSHSRQLHMILNTRPDEFD